MGTFDGKSVVVTGGAQGIGGGVSTGFAQAGASVTVVDIDEAASAALTGSLEKEGCAAQYVIADVSSHADAKRAIEQAVAAFGGVDVLVNNAGIQPMGSYVKLDAETEEGWDRIIGVNLKGCFLMSKYAIPSMRERGGGVVINIASVQGLQSQPLVPAYAASKGGMLSLTRNMALDYAPENIRVVAINPGSMDTPMLRTQARAAGDEDAMVETWGRTHPIGRIGQPADIASAAMFLASDQASFITGEYLCVDGGYMARGAWAGNNEE
ncbi:MAG: glucose 1-dehydrogenase [Chloroflexota bacterium]|nr:glucose 1-dehydrogenase [Chloroflexota bacterium]